MDKLDSKIVNVDDGGRVDVSRGYGSDFCHFKDKSKSDFGYGGKINHKNSKATQPV
ncbi:MAG: hypothetical protein ACLTG2_08920 [Clostridia bacterium]